MRAAIEGKSAPEVKAEVENRPEEALGMEAQTLVAEIAERLGYRGLKGVLVVNVASNSPAAEAGLNRGALIQEVNSKPVENLQSFRNEIKKSSDRKYVLLWVRFGEAKRFIAIKRP